MSEDRPFGVGDLMSEGDEAGVRLSDIANALQVLVITQGYGGCGVSVAQAAEMFNVTPDLVLDAVTDGYWLYLEDAEGGLLSRSAVSDDLTRVFLNVDGD